MRMFLVIAAVLMVGLMVGASEAKADVLIVDQFGNVIGVQRSNPVFVQPRNFNRGFSTFNRGPVFVPQRRFSSFGRSPFFAPQRGFSFSFGRVGGQSFRSFNFGF